MSLISIPAGLLQMSLSRFVFYSLIGTATWTAVLAMAGYALGRAYADAEKYINPFATGVMVLIIGIYVYRFVTFKNGTTG